MPDELQSSTIDRRRFLTVLGVSAGGGAMALSGCSTDRVQKLVPYLVQSEDQVPGVATWYASSCTECSQGCGVHVRTREGRAAGPVQPGPDPDADGPGGQRPARADRMGRRHRPARDQAD